MARSIVMCNESTALNDNTTTYQGVIGTLATGSEASTEIPIRDAGVFNNLYVRASANTQGVTATITFRVSRANSSLTVSYTAGQTGIKEDTSNTASVAATDEIDYQLSAPDDTGTTTISLTTFKVEFAPTATGTCVSLLGAVCATFAFTADSTTFYFLPSGATTGATTTEANHKYRVRSAFVSSDLYTYITANARTTNIVIGTRINAGNGNQSVTYTAGQTGAKEDTSNSDTLAVGDNYNFYLTTSTGSGSDSATVKNITTSMISSNSVFALLNSSNAGDSINFNTTTYTGAAGDIQFTTTEANTQIYPQFNFTAKEFQAFVSANTIATSATSVTLRDNTGDSALTLSYAAAETGLKSDTTNTTLITAVTDEINYKVVTPNTSGAITFQWIGCLGQTAILQDIIMSGVIPVPR